MNFDSYHVILMILIIMIGRFKANQCDYRDGKQEHCSILGSARRCACESKSVDLPS